MDRSVERERKSLIIIVRTCICAVCHPIMVVLLSACLFDGERDRPSKKLVLCYWVTVD